MEKHNHALCSKHEMSLSRAKCGLSYVNHRNIFFASTSKAGVAKSHRLRKAMKGGVGLGGSTVRDYHNFKRQAVNFVGNKDAQMLINTMVARKKCNPKFFYEFKCNERELLNIFWADEIARMNYRDFGDTISFDATFGTNRLVFYYVYWIMVFLIYGYMYT